MSRGVREKRRERNAELKMRGITRCYKRRVCCVTITATPMPEWCYKRRIRGLTMSHSRVWLRPKDAWVLRCLDLEIGGRPTITEAEYRRCPVCWRPLLGEDAEARRELNESSFTARQIPCGDGCLDAAKDKRWRKEDVKTRYVPRY